MRDWGSDVGSSDLGEKLLLGTMAWGQHFDLSIERLDRLRFGGGRRKRARIIANARHAPTGSACSCVFCLCIARRLRVAVSPIRSDRKSVVVGKRVLVV